MLTWLNLVAGELPHTFRNRPLRLVLRLQFLVTLGIAVGAGLWLGAHGAISALLGGMVIDNPYYLDPDEFLASRK